MEAGLAAHKVGHLRAISFAWKWRWHVQGFFFFTLSWIIAQGFCNMFMVVVGKRFTFWLVLV